MTASGERRSFLRILFFTALIFLLGGLVAWLGIRNSPNTARAAPTASFTPSPLSWHEPVAHYDLPAEEMVLPSGPNQKTFTVACSSCHSPRLVFTQPPLTEKQWQGVVHKMVVTYGAPISVEQEKEIVQYLIAGHLHRSE